MPILFDYLVSTNFDFNQVLQNFKLFRNERPHLFTKKVKELILKPLKLSQNHSHIKTNLPID